MSGVNWDDLRVFLTYVRSGNAYNAAQALSIDHTTVRRRIRSLENALSTKLVEAAGSDLTLTEGGDMLFQSLDDIEANIYNVTQGVSGADQDVAGRVRVGAPDGFASIFLASQFADLRRQYPDLSIELVSSSRQFNVASRETDIAIIISFPPPSRHIIRKLGSVNLRLYAAAEYLDSRDPIRSTDDLSGQNFIGYLEDHPFIPPEALSQSEFENFQNAGFVSNSIIAQLNAAAAGAGICLLPGYMAQQASNLRVILPDEVTVPIDMYLLVHADLRKIARYRIISDFIGEIVEREAQLFG